MKPDSVESLTFVKRSVFRHPAVLAAGAAALGALLVVNVAAIYRGMDSPWLLGTAIVADMVAVGVGVLVAAREVLLADTRSEQSDARLESIVDSAMDAIVTVNSQQKIVFFNRAAEQVFGCPRADAIGSPLERFLPARFRAAHRGHVESFGRTGVTGRKMGDYTTLWGLRADGTEFPIEASISQTGTGANRYFTVILRDVTLRRQAEAEALRMRGALSEAQARLGAIVDSAMDAVVTIDEQYRIVLFNRAAEQVFGARREDVLGKPLDPFLPERFRGPHRAHIDKFGSTGVTSRRMGDVTTLWALRADGSEFPIEASISQAVEEGRRYFTVILRDITLRKQGEDALRAQQKELRELSARVLEAREEEKTRIARELHDELGQLLTALKMDLASIRDKITDPELLEKAREMSQMLDQTVSSTRRISADLRPLMLDDLGLADAAAWLAQDFAKRSGVACDARIAPAEELQGVSKNVSTAVYRALQESLTNIARHSGAKGAWVRLEARGGEISLEVEDDGRGIAGGDLHKPRSLGLKGMRERFAYLGGELEISPATRGGTRVRVRVPMQGKAGESAA
ncbi:MAG TPA: PAS domain-containing sensor histidine kinase [Burkholderiales bacterium]|jgi:hypothetical protein|nr:PAS domain-containing sensor histidine kinase [Burkholderiales bacterium]HEX2650137.1 PAS domain-containing sensor histidine kinase [Burkholderiales bacterium]